MNEDNPVYDYMRQTLGLTFFLGRETQDTDALYSFTCFGMKLDFGPGSLTLYL